MKPDRKINESNVMQVLVLGVVCKKRCVRYVGYARMYVCVHVCSFVCFFGCMYGCMYV